MATSIRRSSLARPSLLRMASSAIAVATCGLPAALSAQDADSENIPAASTNLEPRAENGKQIYDAAQFTRFAPRTALDMVRQVPGFTIDSGDSSRRGLGQADENVLINGQRVSGKDNDARTALGRISADNVLRIEIVDGATLSISGLSGQVLNLVTRQDADQGISGQFKWRPVWRDSGNNWFDSEASISGKIGKGNFNLAFENDAFRPGAEGPEDVTDRLGNLIFQRFEEARVEGDRPTLSFHFDRTSEAGSIFNFDVKGQIFRYRERVDTRRVQIGQSDIFELFQGGEDEWNAEVSADYEFALGGGRLKLIGLQRFENSEFENFFGQTFTDGTLPNGSRFDRTGFEGESILRAEYNWKTKGGTDWGISAEGAYNFLDNEGALFSLDAMGNFQPIPIANANSKVEEYRGEVIGTYGRQLSSNLTLQAAVGGEYSRISQTGARGLTRSFVRPKGSLSFAWKPYPDLDFSLKIAREVGQLNFFDFIASADVVNNADNAGNPNLVPPQKWLVELEAQKQLGNWGSTTITFTAEKFSDIVDSIPITATTEARGNLDSAERYGVALVATLLLDPIGWKGAKIDIEADARTSSLRDPLIGNFRPISNQRKYRYEASLRHDVPGSDWAWGAGAEEWRPTVDFRLDQQTLFQNQGPYVWAFIEHKDVAGLTVNFNLGNLLGRGERFTRTAFVDRRDGPIDFVEDRVREFGLIYRLTISGSF